ncbi:MAG: hypothetical protein AAGC67_18285, partial [Myxococcota bacterium]
MPSRPVSSLRLPLGVLALALVATSEASAAALFSEVATARIMSGNVTLTDDTVSGFAPGPVGSTGLVEANGADIVPETPPVDAAAITDHDLPNGALGVSTGFDATSNGPNDTRSYFAYAGGSATWFDDLTVTSTTLPVGTPVNVRFVFDLAFTADATTSLFFARAASDCTSTAAGTQGIAPANHRYLSDIEF